MPFDICFDGIMGCLFFVCPTLIWDFFLPCSVLKDSVDSLAPRFLVSFHPWKAVVGEQRAR